MDTIANKFLNSGVFSVSNVAGVGLSLATYAAGSTLMNCVVENDESNDALLQKYPNMKHNTDIAYLITNILHFKPYAPKPVLVIAALSNQFLGLYEDFAKAKFEEAHGKIKKMSNLVHDVVTELDHLQTVLCQTNPNKVSLLETYKLELEQCLDQLFQNIMMDYQLLMETSDGFMSDEEVEGESDWELSSGYSDY